MDEQFENKPLQDDPAPTEEISEKAVTFEAVEPPSQPQINPQPVYTPPAEPPKKRRRAGKMIALILCVCLVGIGIGVAGTRLVDTFLADHPFAPGATQSTEDAEPTEATEDSFTILEGDVPTAEPGTADPTGPMTPADVYAATVDSTVGITTSVTTTNYWGQTIAVPAAGSGFILTENGYIITNHHVIDDADTITVSFYDGSSVPATLIGSDEANDIAVLKVDKTGLKPVVVCASDNMRVGDDVVAIGNPLGELTFSLTTGIISALDRDVTMSNGITMTLIQTDCAINSGNSGGALFNMYGQVIGITNAKYSSSPNDTSIDNIAFAIPFEDVRDTVESIIKNGYMPKPYVGISVVDVDASAQIYGLPMGAAIQAIAEDSPAAKAGLQVSDIITHANDQEITSKSQLVTLIKKSKVGEEIQLTVYRRGVTLKVTVTIGEQKE